MKYAGPYYSKLKTMSRAHSNMNMLCMSIERWERSMLYKKFGGKNFDWHIMFNDKVGYTQEHFDKIEEIFLDFNICRKSQLLFEKKCKNWKLYRKELEPTITKAEAKIYETNWQAIYNIYRNKCKEICPNVNELANILVVLSYEKYPNKYKKFMWHMAGAGIVDNIEPKEIQIPKKDKYGEYEYLGQKYSLSLPDKHYVSVKK